MTLRRIGKIDVQAKVSGNDIVSTGFVFYSYAKNSNALEFHFKDQQGQPVDLLGTKVRLLLIVREDGEDKEFKTLDEEIVTDSSLNGIVRYIIPDRLMGYQGIVDGWIYFDFPDGSKTDEVHFKFTIERSKIDDAFLDAGDFYIKDFEEIKNQVNQSATEAMALIDSTKSEIEDKLNNLEELRGPKGDTGPMGPVGPKKESLELVQRGIRLEHSPL
ncbi:BppU family phage baseplate upper protein [Enterococcus dispar]|uniref:BppU family phage baseplate upper protein n=1 Tax=Enterococcus dispar TaxID=44009 RepID=UPI00189FC63F|nr:BppU family phage baseplate upper protein [Enterococcus dispar]